MLGVVAFGDGFMLDYRRFGLLRDAKIGRKPARRESEGNVELWAC